MKSSLKQYMRVKKEGDNLFFKQNGKGLVGASGRATLSRWLSKTFYKFLRVRISTQLWRKIYISQLLKGSPTLAHRLEIMRSMGQTSLERQSRYRKL
jgi:hypothetical protein